MGFRVKILSLPKEKKARKALRNISEEEININEFLKQKNIKKRDKTARKILKGKSEVEIILKSKTKGHGNIER